ncbi:hypothetical protein LTR84_011049 [Exophiala bonariae]|uniref:Glycosyl transferase family 1 domain-containing protein n=1 Tax=Exophiala bonariae TaxID=1690606 RepID=A0AAV9NJM9_9EURO|nr:hypothetical protein LTR84_011049 [Exophiala bonariae]
MALILSPHILEGSSLLTFWWQYALLSLAGGATIVGGVYLLIAFVSCLLRHKRARQTPDVVSEAAKAQLVDVQNLLIPHRKAQRLIKPSSFVVFLGDFSTPPTQAELSLLSEAELIILDPFRDGVDKAVGNVHVQGQAFFARLSFQDLLEPNTKNDAVIGFLIRYVRQNLGRSTFTGVVLAGWETVLSPAYLIEALDLLKAASFGVLLEVSPPTFLPPAGLPPTTSCNGIIIRNASILPDGRHRDYFEMQTLQSTIRQSVRESCLRDFAILSWETVEEGVEISNAVLKRAIQWANFYNITPWIATESALCDASQNLLVQEPIGAFDWLKDDRVIKFHTSWKETRTISCHKTTNTGASWNAITEIFPETYDFQLSRIRNPEIVAIVEPHALSTSSNRPHTPAFNDLGNSSCDNQSATHLGCYPVGSGVSALAFAEVVHAQIRLRELGLLHSMDEQTITNLGISYRKFCDRQLIRMSKTFPQAIKSLKKFLTISNDKTLTISLGLSPGFTHASGARFWAVWHRTLTGVEIFLSKDVQGTASTILYTFLLSEGVPQELAFDVEVTFCEWLQERECKSILPQRILQDVDNATPEELLSLLYSHEKEHKGKPPFERIADYAKEVLLETPSRQQFNQLASIDFMKGLVNAEELIRARFVWYEDHGIAHPDIDSALRVYITVNEKLLNLLRSRREEELTKINTALGVILGNGDIDAWADLLGLFVFCSMKKAAIEEIYLEVTDRNPLLNDQADQAAVFSESFALGSRCETYFDINPSEFGQILSNRFRETYADKQPPLWNNGAPDYATVLGGAQIDVDIYHKPKSLPHAQRFTFLSVFALPAIVDVALLSTIGRGLYLSAFMNFQHQLSATMALMISLILSGGTGTWIAHGGTYYLGSMAFSAMNMFVLTRFIAGMSLALITGITGLVILSIVRGSSAGLVFFFYLLGFTSYLNLFAAISCYQFPGTAFLSGRKQVFACLPILILSPIITTWSGHDIFVYSMVLFILNVALAMSLARTAAGWATWFLNVKRISDAEVRKWYIMTKAKGNTKRLNMLSDPAALKISREALLEDVHAELSKSPFSKRSPDKLVAQLAADHESTKFLLDWYCRYADVPRPVPFSSSWNIQMKVAQTTLIELQKGSRLHSSFAHWRQAGQEVGCGLLYFFVALLDKWIDLLCGTPLVGLSASLNDQNRIAVGLGLVYYLIGAVLIDIKAADLNTAGDPEDLRGIHNMNELREHQKQEIRLRRGQYTRVWLKFVALNCWSLAVTTFLIWITNSRLESVITFLVYVFAYTGLIWFQFTKIFSGPDALKPLATGILLGLPVGLGLRLGLPNFRYGSIIALAIATWTAAISCLWKARIFLPQAPKLLLEHSTVYHAHAFPWSDNFLSTQELADLHAISEHASMNSGYRVLVSNSPGAEVQRLLLRLRSTETQNNSFPDYNEMADIALRAWESGQIEIHLIPRSILGPDMLALGCKMQDKVKLFIGIQSSKESLVDIPDQPHFIAELLFQEVAMSYFEIGSHHAWLSTKLITGELPLAVRVMTMEEASNSKILAWAKTEILKQRCLGISCDKEWDSMPSIVRRFVLLYSLGQLDSTNLEYTEVSRYLNLPFDDMLKVHIARCTLYEEIISQILLVVNHKRRSVDRFDHPSPKPMKTTLAQQDGSGRSSFDWCRRKLLSLCKYSVVAILAEPEWQREFDSATRLFPAVVRVPVFYICNFLWEFARWGQIVGLSLFAPAARPAIRKLWHDTKGTTVSYHRDRILVRNAREITTAFKRPDSTGGYMLYHYTGEHKLEPQTSPVLISTYSANGELQGKVEVENGDRTNKFLYEYGAPPHCSRFGRSQKRIPISRRCIQGPRTLETICYDAKGLVTGGSYMTEFNMVKFKLEYRRHAKFATDLLRAEFSMPHISCKVEWCAPPRRNSEGLDRWIPSANVTRASFMQGPDFYESKWTYDHKLHAKIQTRLNGRKVETPPLIEHDWLGLLKKPSHDTFANEDLMLHATYWNTNLVARTMGLSNHVVPISTTAARTMLWKQWKANPDFDGVLTRWLDERLLRSDKVLLPYWTYRNRGDLRAAHKYLMDHFDAIRASVDLNPQISGWTPLAIKMGDLQRFGTGGDSTSLTTTGKVEDDTDNVLHVFAADYGTWPNEGGGVSACRRDLVDSLDTIRWHMVCESANDFGTPKHQTELNVQSLKVIPLWGLDFLTPTHGMFENRLHSEVDMIHSSASDRDIRKHFIPALTALVKGSRTENLSIEDVKQTTRALINLNDYFSEKRYWGEVWRSDITKEAWRSLWLTNVMSNTRPTTEWLDTELPTLAGFDCALEMWLRYLFIFSIKVPDKMPIVYQASHHSVSAAYGIICKLKRGCQLQIWDHAIAWREATICLSSTLCKLPPFVRNSLMGLLRLTSVLVLHHADVILPCADFFNPGWEIEIGTCSGKLEHRNKFKRKISPVVNGIADAEKFKPVKEIKTKHPTVTMLSHLWFSKDLKNAILAADIIVNEWGFKDFKLDVYGSIEKAPIYSTECQELIASKSLRDYVKLCGTADPLHVLEQTWVFLNSSLSEGLPLALGEAALTGAPVVCTDVGASLRVLSDPEDSSLYSAVVAPNDARALARGQIKLLAMLDEFGRQVGEGDAPAMPFTPTAADVEWITARMYEKSDQRRKLGIMTRKIVQKSFGGDRYLREHEQMLWIGKLSSQMQGRAHLQVSDDPAHILHWLSLSNALRREQKTYPTATHRRTSSTLSLNLSYMLEGDDISLDDLEPGYGRADSFSDVELSRTPFTLWEAQPPEDFRESAYRNLPPSGRSTPKQHTPMRSASPRLRSPSPRLRSPSPRLRTPSPHQQRDRDRKRETVGHHQNDDIEDVLSVAQSLVAKPSSRCASPQQRGRMPDTIGYHLKEDVEDVEDLLSFARLLAAKRSTTPEVGGSRNNPVFYREIKSQTQINKTYFT